MGVVQNKLSAFSGETFVLTTEQQTNLKFPVRLGKSSLKSFCMLEPFERVYKEHTLFHSTVSLWNKRLKEGCENDPRCGRPSTSRNETNVELVKKIVRGDYRLTVQLISDELRLNQNSNLANNHRRCGNAQSLCKDDPTPKIILNILTSFYASFVPERNC